MGYSKTKIKAGRGIKYLIIFFALVVILCVCFLVFVEFKSKLVLEKKSTVASLASDDEALNSTPIIVDNIIVGAIYQKKWVLAESYYLKSKNKENFEIDMYNNTGKLGEFSLKEVRMSAASKALYVTTTNNKVNNEYIAVAKGSSGVLDKAYTKVETTKKDYESVKSALGWRRLYNHTMEIQNVYEANINQQGQTRIIFVTNQKGKSRGVYSAVILVDSMGKATCIKYYYVRDTKNAADWPIYSLKFVADINGDGIKEIVLQEIKEFEIKYDVLEYEKGIFTEVLSTTVKSN